MEFPYNKVMLFAKAPEPGKVKTRLIPDVGVEQATEIHRQLVLNALDRLCADPICHVELWCAPDCDHPFFQQCLQHYPISLHQQCGGDLGERMHNALSTGTPHGASLLIGSDIPAIDIDYLRRGFAALEDDSDWVLGPAEDGGYVMVGCKRSEMRFFSDVTWGSDRVLEQTIRNVEKMGVSLQLLEPLWDLDNYQDLLRWKGLEG